MHHPSEFDWFHFSFRSISRPSRSPGLTRYSTEYTSSNCEIVGRHESHIYNQLHSDPHLPNNTVHTTDYSTEQLGKSLQHPTSPRSDLEFENLQKKCSRRSTRSPHQRNTEHPCQPMWASQQISLHQTQTSSDGQARNLNINNWTCPT